MQRLWATPLVVSSGIALALAGAACSNNSNDANGSRTQSANSIAGTTGQQNAAVTLTGCLQKSSGVNNFILAPANTATHGSVGTSGAAASGDVVGREQEAAAERSYRLSGDNDQLNGMVGKQVRVRGHMTDQGDLHGSNSAARADRDERGTSGSADRDRHDIDADDLAKVDVVSIDRIADACGTTAQAASASGGAREKGSAGTRR